MVLLLLALVPVFLILVSVDRQDLRPEPRSVVWITLLLGALSAAPVALVELGSDALFADLLREVRWGNIPRTLFTALLGAALPEELAKFSVLYLYVRRHRAFDEPMDGLVYGAAAALGFAGVENVLYVLDGGARTALLRGLIAVPGHAFDGMLMGSLLAVGMVRPRSRGRYTALALLLPTICHTLYDAPLLLALTPLTSGEAPSWATVVAGCALAPLPVVITALQWNLLRDLTARLRRAQLASLSGVTTERHLVPILGGILDGLLRWALDGGLRGLFKLGALFSGLSALLFSLLSAAALHWSPQLHLGLVETLADPTMPVEFTRLGVDGCERTLALFLGGSAAEAGALVAGFLYAARRLRREESA
jgi:RsiW-degrading membrane proteinase PrsW (M82 family)